MSHKRQTSQSACKECEGGGVLRAARGISRRTWQGQGNDPVRHLCHGARHQAWCQVHRAADPSRYVCVQFGGKRDSITPTSAPAPYSRSKPSCPSDQQLRVVLSRWNGQQQYSSTCIAHSRRRPWVDVEGKPRRWSAKEGCCVTAAGGTLDVVLAGAEVEGLSGCVASTKEQAYVGLLSELAKS